VPETGDLVIPDAPPVKLLLVDAPRGALDLVREGDAVLDSSRKPVGVARDTMSQRRIHIPGLRRIAVRAVRVPARNGG
jgi:hypothetical protein